MELAANYEKCLEADSFLRPTFTRGHIVESNGRKLQWLPRIWKTVFSQYQQYEVSTD